MHVRRLEKEKGGKSPHIEHRKRRWFSTARQFSEGVAGRYSNGELTIIIPSAQNDQLHAAPIVGNPALSLESSKRLPRGPNAEPGEDPESTAKQVQSGGRDVCRSSDLACKTIPSRGGYATTMLFFVILRARQA